jgi:hypothetical protein
MKNSLIHGSKAHRAHMSEVMKASWAKRKNKIAAREAFRNKIKARKALRNFSDLTHNLAPAGKVDPDTTAAEIARIVQPDKPLVPVATRFVAFNYCPNCGVHLERLYGN